MECYYPLGRVAYIVSESLSTVEKWIEQGILETVFVYGKHMVTSVELERFQKVNRSMLHS